MRQRRNVTKTTFAALLAAASIGLGACGSVPAPSGAAPSGAAPSGAAPSGAAPSGGPQVGGTIVVSCPENGITTIDPAKTDNGTCQRIALRALYSTLVKVDEAGTVLPEVATSWDVSPDGLTIDFTLRDDVKFHDGSTVTADDVVFSFDRQIDPATIGAGAAQLRGHVVSAAATSPTSVKFTLARPNASLFIPLAQSWALPIVSRSITQTNGNLERVPGGSGPFVLDTYQPGGEATFKRNDQYFDTDEGGRRLPYLDGFKLVGLAETSARFLNLQSRDFDIITTLATQDVITAQAAESGITIWPYQDTVPTLAINTKVAPFDDKRVRQAFVQAIDRQGLIDVLSLKTGALRPHFWIRGSWVDIETPDFTFDQDAARKALADAGYPNGFTVRLAIIARPGDQQTAQLVQQDLEAVGVTVQIDAMDRTAWIAEHTVGPHQTPLVLYVNRSNPDPNKAFGQDFAQGSTSNYAVWDDADSAKLLDVGRQAIATTDRGTRRELYQEAVEILVDAAAYVALGNWPTPDASQVWISGVAHEPLGELRMDRVSTTKSR